MAISQIVVLFSNINWFSFFSLSLPLSLSLNHLAVIYICLLCVLQVGNCPSNDNNNKGAKGTKKNGKVRREKNLNFFFTDTPLFFKRVYFDNKERNEEFTQITQK